MKIIVAVSVICLLSSCYTYKPRLYSTVRYENPEVYFSTRRTWFNFSSRTTYPTSNRILSHNGTFRIRKRIMYLNCGDVNCKWHDTTIVPRNRFFHYKTFKLYRMKKLEIMR